MAEGGTYTQPGGRRVSQATAAAARQRVRNRRPGTPAARAAGGVLPRTRLGRQGGVNVGSLRGRQRAAIRRAVAGGQLRGTGIGAATARTGRGRRRAIVALVRRQGAARR